MFFWYVVGGRWVVGRLVFVIFLSLCFVMGKRKFFFEFYEDFEFVVWESFDIFYFEYGKSLLIIGFLKDKIF